MTSRDEAMLEAKEKAKGMLKSYLESQGINTSKNFSCLSIDHEDSHPSMSYIEKTNTVYCHGCGECGDIFDVVRMQYGIPKNDYKAIFETTYKILGIDIDSTHTANYENNMPILHRKEKKREEKSHVEEEQTDFTQYFKTVETRINETDYPDYRGIAPEVVKRFRLGFDPEWKHPHLSEETKKKVIPSPRLIIPTSKNSYLARDTRNNLNEKQKQFSKMKVGKINIFNKEALRQIQTPVFVVEGEIDAMSIISVGGEAVALGSAANVNLFLKECKNNPPQMPLIICADNDKIGKKAMETLSNGLVSAHIPFIFSDINDKYKDANERLMNDSDGLKKSVKLSIECSKNIIQSVKEDIKLNDNRSPLFSSSNFKEIVPLEINDSIKNLSTKEIYNRLIKRITIENKKATGIYEADYSAIQFLHKNGFNSSQIEKIMIESPRISHLSKEMKNTEVKYFIRGILNQKNISKTENNSRIL